MILSRRAHLQALTGMIAGGALSRSAGQVDFGSYSDVEKEKFLRSAKIVSVEAIGHGVTKPVKAELELDGVKHSAQIQVVNKSLPDFFAQDGTRAPMMDSWRFNVAAYKIDRLLNLGMVAVAAPRIHAAKPAAFSWWVDNVMFEEVDRVKQKATPPDTADFDKQIAVSRVFDELIINIDRNLSNMLITKSWKVALIDHSRSFNTYNGIRNTENLTRCSRALLDKLKTLGIGPLAAAVGKHLTRAESLAVLARRDRIVEYFVKLAKEKGEENVLFS